MLFNLQLVCILFQKFLKAENTVKYMLGDIPAFNCDVNQVFETNPRQIL